MSYNSEPIHMEGLLGVHYTYKAVYLKELINKLIEDVNLIIKCTTRN